jgi:5-methylcytosine-specific restriction endonuclease McrA
MATGSPNPFYGSDKWKAARRECLRRARYRCALCGADLRGLGRSRVDHQRTLKESPELALVQSNLRALCVSCDNARHAEKGGAAADRGCDADGVPRALAHHWNKKL